MKVWAHSTGWYTFNPASALLYSSNWSCIIGTKKLAAAGASLWTSGCSLTVTNFGFACRD